MNETKHFRGEGGGAAGIERQNIYASPSSFLNVKKNNGGKFAPPHSSHHDHFCSQILSFSSPDIASQRSGINTKT